VRVFSKKQIAPKQCAQCRSGLFDRGGIPDAWSSFRLVGLDCTKHATTRSPEVALNQKVKKLIQKLGEAIHESVSESENIAGVVKNIREQGFDVLLMLEATIGLNEVEADDAEAAAEEASEAADGPFTRNDLNFLKSLRISLPDEKPDAPSAEQKPHAKPRSRPALPSSTQDSSSSDSSPIN
jgi:hypothetical protein